MTDAHPGPDRLAAFRLGRLDEAELTEIEGHVSRCASCCRALKTLPDDSFVALVQRSADASARTQAAGDTPADPEAAVPRDLLGHPRYLILDKVGQGGMGVVYKARHRLMDRVVALKVLRPGLLDRPDWVERFRREVRGAARLVHPHIVTAYDAEQAGDTHFLVMEYVEGVSLARLVEEQGPLPVKQACAYARQAALGLQHAYACGMIHRDIKPQNLIEAKGTGQVKILDFGLARFVSEAAEEAASPAAADPAGRLTQASTLMGTPEYVAPEQIEAAHAADIRADIYSLGCTLYYLLAGHAPFPHGSPLQKITAHLEEAPRPLGELRPDVPAALERVIGRMMEKDPARRYQTPAEVAAALAPWAEEPRPAAAPPRRRNWLPVAAGVLVVVLGSFFSPRVREFAQTVVRVVTNRGVLEIEAEDKDLEITVKQSGKDVVTAEVVDRGTKRTFELTAAGGEILAKEMPDGVRAKTTQFELTRGGRRRFQARVLLPEGDLKLLQGRWVAVAGEQRGQPLPQVRRGGVELIITGDEAQYTVEGKREKGTVKLDSTKDPRWINVIRQEGKNRFGVMNGIYRLDGDTLKIALGDLDDARPTAFRTGPDTGDVAVLTLRRGSDVQLLQGRWVAVAGEQHGRPLPQLPRGGFELVIAGDEARYTSAGKTEKGTVKLDPAKDPRWIDVTRAEGHNRFGVMNGTYRLDGDTLTLALGDLDDMRPTAFKTGPTTGDVVVLTLRRTPAAPPAFRPLFDGKGLAGWKGNFANIWRWEQGELRGKIPAGSGVKDCVLISPRTYRDFELKCQVRHPTRNKEMKAAVSLFFRCDTPEIGKPFWGYGPEVFFGEVYPGRLRNKVGGWIKPLVDETEAGKHLKQDEFNDFALTCHGRHVTVRVNGVTTYDGEWLGLAAEGLLVWKIYGGDDGNQVTIRNIEIKEE
jgi:uncharacterized protein (TIGR03067 family)